MPQIFKYPFLYACIIICLSVYATSVSAIKPSEILSDPILEERARSLSVNFRCLVCQNQSIDDSEAELAQDLRLIIRTKLQEGYSDSEITAYLVERYGEFILLKPAVNQHTIMLWLSPFVFATLGGVLLFLWYRRRNKY